MLQANYYGFASMILFVFAALVAPELLCRDRRERTPSTVSSWTDVPAVPTGAFKEVALVAGDPLGMVDTRFTATDPARLAVPYGDGDPVPHDLDGEITEERLGQVHEMAATLLSNPVIEDFEVRVVTSDLDAGVS